MKLIQIILLILTFSNCRHYFVRDAAKYNLTQEEESILKSKKIGVVGFHPFCGFKNDRCGYFYSENNNFHNIALQFIYENDPDQINFHPFFFVTGSGKSRQEHWLSSSNTAKEFFKFENQSDLTPAAHHDKSISREKLRSFLKTYLDEARHLGQKEIYDLLEFSENSFYLKNNNFDYWIIGFHAPQQRRKKDYLKAFSLFPFLFSFGIIPYWNEEIVKSSFWIFDKRLNLLKKIEYENEINYIAASWFLWRFDDEFFIDNSTPAYAYEPDLKEFQKELVKIMKNTVD